MTNPLKRTRGRSRLIRVILAAGAVFALSACATPSADNDPIAVTTSTVRQTANRVGAALNEVSLRLSAQMSGDEEDLILAWNDFEGDVRSVVDDLVSKPSRVDIEGVQKRVEALGELLDDSALDLPADEWDEFTSAFQTLVDEVSTTSASN